MNKAEGFVRSRCMAKIYGLLELNYVQRTNNSSFKHVQTQKSVKANETKLNKTNERTNQLKLEKSGRAGSKVQKNSKSKTELHLDQFEAIIHSPIYMKLSQEYSEIKSKQDIITKEVRKDILTLNDSIAKQQNQLLSLNNLKQSLENQTGELRELYNNVRLQNYELQCQLYAQRGYGYEENYYYDSQQELQYQEMDYEALLQLEERLEHVSQGYNQQEINSLKGQSCSNQSREKQGKCCICCEQFGNGDAVFITACGHVHHFECLKKWLRVKRQCPLCRHEIILS